MISSAEWNADRERTTRWANAFKDPIMAEGLAILERAGLPTLFNKTARGSEGYTEFNAGEYKRIEGFYECISLLKGLGVWIPPKPDEPESWPAPPGKVPTD